MPPVIMTAGLPCGHAISPTLRTRHQLISPLSPSLAQPEPESSASGSRHVCKRHVCSGCSESESGRLDGKAHSESLETASQHKASPDKSHQPQCMFLLCEANDLRHDRWSYSQIDSNVQGSRAGLSWSLGMPPRLGRVWGCRHGWAEPWRCDCDASRRPQGPGGLISSVLSQR
jgi:hypothetical protein